MPARHHHTRAAVAALQRQVEALRRTGLLHREIAARLGLSLRQSIYYASLWRRKPAA